MDAEEERIDQAFTAGHDVGFGSGFHDGVLAAVKSVENLLRERGRGGFISVEEVQRFLSDIKPEEVPPTT